MQSSEIATDQRFFFGASPSLNLHFSRNRFLDGWEFLCEYQLERPMSGREAVHLSNGMLVETMLEMRS